jgi:branched-chain amino acid transport system substrate-binding protein
MMPSSDPHASSASVSRRQVLVRLAAGAALGLDYRGRPAWAQARLAGPELRLGAAFPLTGVWSEWGKKDRIALDIAVEEINAARADDPPLRYLLYDTGSRPTEAAAVVRRLATDDRVLAILGPFSSSECEVAFPVGNQLKVPMIAQASSKPGIGAANRPWAFRTNVDEARMAQPAVKFWVTHYQIKTAAVVHDAKDAVGQFLGTRVLPAAAKQHGVALVNEGNFVTFQTKDLDFSAQVTQLKTLKFDGLLFGGAYPDAINFVKEARRQGLRQPMVGGSPLMHENFARMTAEAGEGIVAPNTFDPALPDERVQRFVRKFADLARAAGLPTTAEWVNVNVYDTVHLLVHLVKQRGVTNRPEDLARDRERIMQGLTETRAFPGLAGRFGFNKDGDGVKDIYVMMVKGGRWVQVEHVPAQG